MHTIKDDLAIKETLLQFCKGRMFDKIGKYSRELILKKFTERSLATHSFLLKEEGALRFLEKFSKQLKFQFYFLRNVSAISGTSFLEKD